MYTAERRARAQGSLVTKHSGSAPGSDEISELKTLILALRNDIQAMQQGGGDNGNTVANSPAETDSQPEDPTDEEIMTLKTEVKALAHAIQQTKREIAALRSPNADKDQISAVTDELDAVVQATEDATNTILEAAETIDNVAEQLRSSDDTFVNQLGEQLAEQSMKVFEACNFQDITGQRINKVVNGMKFVEERIQAMIAIWGEEDFAKIAPSTEINFRPDDPDASLLSGPQLEGKGISQDEIDALFD
ncbi:MAG: protein phosphatase CheZ [Rhodospirillales bacterium]